MEWDALKLLKATGSTSSINTWVARRVVIDSRQVQPGDLFIAIKGKNYDGHDFIAEAAKKGAVAALVSENITSHLPLIRVFSSLEALQNMARYARSLFFNKVIAITGSCGKTSTKEILVQLLSKTHQCYSNPGNFNNEIGLPLSLVNAPLSCDFIILEMGMSAKGEIAFLSNLAQPDVGIITNTGHGHVEFFTSPKQIAKAKGEIIKGLKTALILNQDTPFFGYLKHLALKSPKKLEIFNYGKALSSFTLLHYNPQTLTVTIEVEKQVTHFISPWIGIHHVYNIIAALSALYVLTLPWKYYLPYIPNLKLPEQRGTFLNLTFEGKRIVLIDDSYNATPEGVLASLESIKNFSAKRKIAVLGDMLELGKYTSVMHTALLPLLQGFNIIIFIGIHIQILKALVNTKRVFTFKDVNQVIPVLLNLLEEGDCILIKGSRRLQLDQIVKALKTHPLAKLLN